MKAHANKKMKLSRGASGGKCAHARAFPGIIPAPEDCFLAHRRTLNWCREGPLLLIAGHILLSALT